MASGPLVIVGISEPVGSTDAAEVVEVRISSFSDSSGSSEISDSTGTEAVVVVDSVGTVEELPVLSGASVSTEVVVVIAVVVDDSVGSVSGSLPSRVSVGVASEDVEVEDTSVVDDDSVVILLLLGVDVVLSLVLVDVVLVDVVLVDVVLALADVADTTPNLTQTSWPISKLQASSRSGLSSRSSSTVKP
ncbi:hypothetical protein VTJ49DRAFT_4811 [Mycothermus thermophilus]|uniref:Uncharacterized protein n=1 Tax=Humicola insolens TaxID=85995 RepID=A0ABR3V4L8_HUMIN